MTCSKGQRVTEVKPCFPEKYYREERGTRKEAGWG